MLFPIDSLKNEILQSLDKKDFLIIKSTPGSGKTTRVPLFLKEKYKKKIYILEPRKLAAKLASQYVAKGLGETPGQSVGHIFKYDNSTSKDTQIIFLTEGTFLRILANDPHLNDCDVVILDEFHERHYYTDVALSFLLKIKEKNESLKIIIMSATINLLELETLLGNRTNNIILNENKHNLEIHYLPNDTLVLKEPLERKVYNSLLGCLDSPGHVLIFLPGMFEIKKCEDIIKNNLKFEVLVLHGELGGLEINDEFYHLENKKIILSTNIAESSVTIPGVRTVIDSGLHKISRLNPITRLPIVELKKISQSSAIQRANRATREADGKAFRLYSEFDLKSRDHFDTPEINRTDLCELILSAADIFNATLGDLSFLAPLQTSEIDNANKYLEQIGFLDNNTPTPLAKKLSRFPFHPRIAKILNEAADCDQNTYREVLDYLADIVEPRSTGRFKSLANKFFKSNPKGASLDFEKIMLFGYVDQIAKLANNKLIHMNGETYNISPHVNADINPTHLLWIIIDLDNRNQVIKMLPIEEEWLFDLPFFPIEEVKKIEFSTESLKLSVENISKIGAIVLSREKIAIKEFPQDVVAVVTKKMLPIFEEKLKSNSFQRLLIFEKYSTKKIKDYLFSDWFNDQISYLLNDESYNLEVILNAYEIELFNFLNEDLGFDLDKDLPLSLQLHDKRKVSINYDLTNGIHCESFIQDFYGLADVPSILKGNEKMKIHLIGPHKRAVQVTQDLKSFWDKAYKELVNELKRDYPRHYWPADPQKALPIFLLKNVNKS